jgi:hypothetical protein
MPAVSRTRWALHSCVAPTPGTLSTTRGVGSSPRSGTAPGVGGNDCRRCPRNPVIGDTVRVGTRVGTVTDVGTVLIQFQTNDGCLRVACPWEVVRISSLPQGVGRQPVSQQQLGVGS